MPITCLTRKSDLIQREERKRGGGREGRGGEEGERIYNLLRLVTADLISF